MQDRVRDHELVTITLNVSQEVSPIRYLCEGGDANPVFSGARASPWFADFILINRSKDLPRATDIMTGLYSIPWSLRLSSEPPRTTYLREPCWLSVAQCD